MSRGAGIVRRTQEPAPPFPTVPFDVETCTLTCRATPEEQAAFDAHRQASLTSRARARQAALLRSILPDPFAQPAPPVRGEVFAGADEDPDVLALYCDGCAPRREGLKRMVIFDLRGYCCSACRRPLGVRVH